MVDQIKRVGGARHTMKYFQPGNRLMKMIRVNVWVVYPVNQLKLFYRLKAGPNLTYLLVLVV